MRHLNTLCSILVELSLLMFFAVILLLPLHASQTQHLDVETMDGTHVRLDGEVRDLHVGDTVPLYRFNDGWKSPIGISRIESVGADTAIASIDPSSFAWPVGRSAKVTQINNTFTVALGSDLGFSDGDTLSLFRDRELLGQATISHVGAQSSELVMPVGTNGTQGIIAGEFLFETQATYVSSSYLYVTEIVIISLLLIAYAVIYVRQKRSPFLYCGEKLLALPLSRRTIFWLVNILACIPFTWFVTKMPIYFLAYFLGLADQYFFGQFIYLRPMADSILPYAYTLVAAFYLVYVLRFRRSPILDFWQRISYKGHAPVAHPNFKRGILLWALHLLVVYVFASTLLQFLVADTTAAIRLSNNLSSPAAFFEMMKNAIWALTVVGCLLGYGYSVVSILWGTYIRNLDFTVVGWLTNGFAYPIFGVVIWQMVPSLTGTDPVITAGPLYQLMLLLGLTFNLLYLLSIWNLGTMFDLMADKGVRTSLFYSVIRHPNYTLEACMFFILDCIGLSGPAQLLALSMTFLIYWIRSEREDNFMQFSNQDYAAYQKATPYKFIPGIY